MLGRWQRWRADVPVWIALTCAAGYYAFKILPERAELGQNIPSFDIYAWTYPNFLYVLRALEQGHGLLWNSLQNSGQPFMGILPTALFYPLNILFLVVDIDIALVSIAAIHLVIGGVGTYVLIGELGVGRVARLCGALAFELGAVALYLSAWVPQIAGAYVWMPWALFLCEKILRSPRYQTGAVLGIILTIELVSGYPQLSVFIYQIIALRVVWELITRRGSLSVHTFGVFALGLFLPLLLGAAQMFPAFETAGESLRQGKLVMSELRTMSLSWEEYRAQVGMRGSPYGGTVALVPVALAVLGLMRRQTRRLAVFAALVTIIYVTLAFNEAAFELYSKLPLGSLFRVPSRFLWCAGFSSSLLVAFGAAVVVESAQERRLLRIGAPIACLVSILALHWLAPAAVQVWECLLVLGVLIASLAATVGAPGVHAARLVLPVLLMLNLFGVGAVSYIGLIKDSSTYYENSDAFEFVKSRRTLQDRIHIVGRHADFSLMSKSASIFDVPTIGDYEPQTSLRYAGFYVYLMLNSPMRSVNQFYYPLSYVPGNRPLLNLVAARYLIVDTSVGDLTNLVARDMEMIWKRGTIRVYENHQALPRAYFVPLVRVIEDPDRILPRLSQFAHDPRRAALVAGSLPDGFGAGRARSSGEVTIVQDRSEEVSLEVQATADGFLVLTDQYYPGWEATVNGEPTEIVVANHAFRLIQVPAGHSRVVFRYRPDSLWVGALVSTVTILALVGLFWSGARQRLRRLLFRQEL